MKKPTSGGGPVAIDWKIERGLASRPSGDGDANGDEHSRTSKRSIAIEETAVRRRKSEDLGGFLSHLVASSEDLLMIDPGLDEEDGPFFAFFCHFVILLFARVFVFRALLRFEANVRFPLFGS